MSDHEPGLYRKGDVVRRASTRSDAVALRFDGFAPVSAENTTRKDLQEQAKALGIDARQSNEKLAAAIAVETAGSPEGNPDGRDTQPQADDGQPESPLDGGGPAIVLDEDSPLSGDDPGNVDRDATFEPGQPGSDQS